MATSLNMKYTSDFIYTTSIVVGTECRVDIGQVLLATGKCQCLMVEPIVANFLQTKIPNILHWKLGILIHVGFLFQGSQCC